MASKKIGRLAGLAALAGLAYMNKDKLFGAKDKTPDAAKSESKNKSYDRDTDTGVDAIASDAVKKPAVDLGEIRDEEGRLSTLRRNTETGETYDPIGSSPAKVARAEKAPSASSVKAPIIGGPTPARDPGGAGKRGAVSPGPNPVRAPGGVGKRGGVGDGGQSMVERQNAGARRAGLSVDDYITSGKKTIDEQDGTFKRGGKVKKMASGGMASSASKRGDGIATKGKTRGRMC